ncbi:hypothetical protein CAL29_17685 [Bordetella genomosp. 10]|uniref:Uncharacterized protein n=1 Tax=Bordetella genomosp. 10 TaxID=1416804 RepID=A0A261RYC8_9BORD|nr:hypothetical protein CAL29_17685 [Bordetella genomosp. 10]
MRAPASAMRRGPGRRGPAARGASPGGAASRIAYRSGEGAWRRRRAVWIGAGIGQCTRAAPVVRVFAVRRGLRRRTLP